MIDYKLKRCPFCGAKASLINYNLNFGTVTVGCNNEDCDITLGKGYFNEKDAIEKWNSRDKESDCNS